MKGTLAPSKTIHRKQVIVKVYWNKINNKLEYKEKDIICETSTFANHTNDGKCEQSK